MVSFAEFNSRGRHNWLVQDLRNATSALAELLQGRSRPLMIQNVTTSGHFVGQAGTTLHRMMKSLRESDRVYRQGNSIVFLTGGNRPGRGCSPTPIAVDGTITTTASAIVSNVLMCSEVRNNATGKRSRPDQPVEYEVQFSVPSSVLQQVVVVDGFVDELPEAQIIINHPVFDRDFQWLDVGYHQDQRILEWRAHLKEANVVAVANLDELIQTGKLGQAKDGVELRVPDIEAVCEKEEVERNTSVGCLQ